MMRVLCLVVLLAPAAMGAVGPAMPVDGQYGCGGTVDWFSCGVVGVTTTCRNRSIFTANASGFNNTTSQAALLDYEFSVAVITLEDPPTYHLATEYANDTVSPRFRMVVEGGPVWLALGALHATDGAGPLKLVSYWEADCS